MAPFHKTGRPEVILDPFRYLRPLSVDEAVAQLDEYGERAKVIAGGQSLLPLMKLGLVVPEVLVDIGRVESLDFIDDRGDRLVIGGSVTHAVLARSRPVRDGCPVLSHAASLVGDPSVRHRGTIGGSIAHGDPAGDLPVVAMALNAEVVVAGPRGRRSIPANDFFVGFWDTALQPSEIVVEVHFPKGIRKWGYEKFARRSFDWAIVGVVGVALPNGEVQIALANMAPRPVRAVESERAIRSGASASGAASVASAGLEPPSDVNGSGEYRRHLAEVLCQRILERIC